eukprot:1444185-Prymnesium_polylepis.1
MRDSGEASHTGLRWPAAEVAARRAHLVSLEGRFLEHLRAELLERAAELGVEAAAARGDGRLDVLAHRLHQRWDVRQRLDVELQRRLALSVAFGVGAATVLLEAPPHALPQDAPLAPLRCWCALLQLLLRSPAAVFVLTVAHSRRSYAAAIAPHKWAPWRRGEL